MDERRGRTVASVMAATALALTSFGLLVQLRLPPEWRSPVMVSPDLGVGLAFPLVGAFLVWQRPRLSLAWLMCVGGLLGAGNVIFAALMLRYAAWGEFAVAGVLRWIDVAFWAVAGFLLAIVLPLYSPTGRLPSRRWRPVVVAGAVATVAEIVLIVVRPTPDPATYAWPVVIPNALAIEALAPYYDLVLQVLLYAVQVCVVAALLSLVVRLRRADPVTRRQIAWPLVAFAGYVAFYLAGESAVVLASAWTAIIPLAILFSALRYRLYGIDTVISRTFVAAGVLAVVSGVYFGVSGLSSLLASGYHQVAGLAAALFSGAFFQPLRRALLRAVDRMLYGRVGDPRVLTDRLTQEVRRADPADALAAVVAVVRDGLAVDGAAVEVTDGRPGYVESGDVGGSPREISLVWHGEPVGRLLIGEPGARRFAAAHDERVIATLLPHVADVAHAVRMAADLQRSRERILATREEERRRLRRDLHDGLGQTLSGMAMTINMARLSLKRSPATADDLLRDLRTGMEAVTSDIRELVYGLRPPALDDLGLAGAVRALAEEGPPAAEVVIEGETTGLPAAVEVAAYRVVQEALTNVRRHAEATRVRVTLRRDAADLRVCVTDDGIGLPEGRRAGVGTSSMRERAAELGGSCLIVAVPEGGTVVEARFPLTAALGEPLSGDQPESLAGHHRGSGRAGLR
ncbi:sensor histidine kinase [Microtetraspora sp. AC03309]|uniref:sensor histidine kinase n=1 Tax=Microtetraspora sp. AC03309 TaxID=2779376 RepID=UPI001E3F92CD|nr:sensor histidine kinase [Microtetraspora sp. AC03309]MCC5578895.1 sensor histidine kinase [Microtetraspora sp. AC03309]